MPGLVPGIHVFTTIAAKQDVDGRDKPGHDEKRLIFNQLKGRENAGCIFGQALGMTAYGVFERGIPSDLTRGWMPVCVKQARQGKNPELWF